MRQCKCGGPVNQYDLTRGREAWHCLSCGRHEIQRGSDENASTKAIDKVRRTEGLPQHRIPTEAARASAAAANAPAQEELKW